MKNELILMRYYYAQTVSAGQAIPLACFRLDEIKSRAFAFMKFGRAARELKRAILKAF
ncbi:hypothetical protein [uncultured Paraglaciecola sp.]|uniref:hypothetical protein n=1 Tax=uncultured Paraglaciecola sp. TaxID=1765024 RepID=UPI002635A5F3|nr:hypothetical protein [uncultured Paraglaciecola sp.]